MNWPLCITCTSIRGSSQSTLLGDKVWCIIAPIERYNGYRHVQWKKKELQSTIHWFCLFSQAVANYIFECYRKTYLSERTEFNRVYFLRFCTEYDAWFLKYRIELTVASSSTTATIIFGVQIHKLQVTNLVWHKMVIFGPENLCIDQYFLLFPKCFLS